MRTSDAILSWQPNEVDLYNKRQLWLKSVWQDLELPKSEIEFWQEREIQIKMPYVYQHHEAYRILTSYYQTVGVFVLMYGNIVFVAIVTSIFVMVLSELLHSNIATLAVSTGLYGYDGCCTRTV